MAYVTQEDKKRMAPAIKAVLKKYGMKGSVAVRNHMVLVCNIKAGRLNLLGAAQKHNDLHAERRGIDSYTVSGHLQVNPYSSAEDALEAGYGNVSSFYEELIEAMYGTEYFDHSDIQSDYFHCSHYININVGQWDTDYVYTA